MPPRYTTVARCVDPDCRCDHRAGLILYHGESAREAVRAKQEAPHGYEVRIERQSADDAASVAARGYR